MSAALNKRQQAYVSAEQTLKFHHAHCTILQVPVTNVRYFHASILCYRTQVTVSTLAQLTAIQHQ